MQFFECIVVIWVRFDIANWMCDNVNTSCNLKIYDTDRLEKKQKKKKYRIK